MTDPVRPDRWGSARRILAVRLDALGDVLMTGPALRALSGDGAREVTLLTSPSGAEVAGLLPDLHDVLVYDAPWMKATAPRTDETPDLAFLDRLRTVRYDAAVILTVYSQNPLPAALLCYLAGIPLRAAHCRENPYQLLTDWVAEPEPERMLRHEVRRQLDLVGSLGFLLPDERLRLRVPDDAAARVSDLLGRLRLAPAGSGLMPDVPWAVIHPGATAPSRRYPPEGFAAAARSLAEEHGWRLVFTGSEEERPLVDAIRAAIPVPTDSLVGRLSLAELAAVLKAAPVLISNNTGPVHLAAALATPVVDLYAGTNLQHTPWMVPSRVLSHPVPCAPCYKSVCPLGHHLCLRGVAPDAIVQSALELAALRPDPRRFAAEAERAQSPLSSHEPAVA